MADEKEPVSGEQRMYGVPESVHLRGEQPERLELFVDRDEEAADRTRLIQEAINKVLADPKAAAAFRNDPRAYLEEAGLPDVVAAWESVEVKLGQALGDEQLMSMATTGDVAGFVDHLQRTGIIPPSLDVALNESSAMGFSPVAVFAAVVLIVVAVWSQAAVAVSALAAVQVLVAVALGVWLAAWVTGPGGDNPDESNDASSRIPQLPKMNTPHVSRLLNKYLNTDLLQKLAARLHDEGFAQEVTGELIKRAILAAWKKVTTGEVPEADREKLYSDILTALGSKELLEQVPELASAARYAMLSAGFAGSCLDLMVKMHEPVRFTSIDFNPQELVRYQKVLIIPTGGLYGLDKSGTFKDRLAEYIRLGGTVICMSQQHGYDFAALPGGIRGYGWAEDQSCHAQSVVITAPHPIFAGQDTDIMDVAIDGFFTEWPEDAQVLLRRRVNGQPALLTYRYGAGRVVVTSAYADWGIAFNQMTRDERLLMRDMLAWARLADQEVPEYDPDQLPFRLTFTVTNRATRDATRILLHAVDPDKQLYQGRYTLDVPVAAGESREVSLEAGDMTALGYWSLDAVLQDEAGSTLDQQYDAATFLVNNFDDTVDGVGYKSEPITFSVVADEERLLEGASTHIRVLIWNQSAQVRTVSVAATMSRNSPESRTVQLPAGRRTEVLFEYGPLHVAGYRFFAYIKDENQKSLGSANKGIFVYQPAATVKVTTAKKAYRPGERITVQMTYRNATRAVFAADMLVAVTDPNGATLYDERMTDTLRPEIPGERSFSFTLPMTVRYGMFKVRVETEAAGRRIGYDEVFFTPLLEGTLAGTVLDAVTGKPAPGAWVQLDSQPPATLNAETGAFRFTAPAGGHWVYAEAPGYGRARAYTVVVPERTAEVEALYLSPQKGQVEGYVMDLVTDQPVKEARVSPEGLAVQSAGEDGAFRVDLPRGERRVDVEAPGYAGRLSQTLQVFPSRTSKIASLYLTPTHGWIEGVVRRADTGEPLPGAELYTPGSPAVSVGADGRFSLPFPTGQRDLRVRAPGYAEAQLVAYIPAGRGVRVEDFFLVPSFGEVTGTVYDAVTRAPVEGARVIASGAPLAVTGPDGRYHFRLPAQSQTLEAQASGFQGSSVAVNVVEGKTFDGLDLGLLPRKGRLEGVVMSASTGLPLAGARLRDDTGVDAITGEDGAFAFTVDVRQHTLAVEATGHAALSITADVYPGQATRLDTIFLTPRTGEVAGRLVDPEGAPVADARVWADGGGEGRTGDDGRFRVTALKGQVWLHAEAAGFQPLQRFALEVQPGQATEAGDLAMAQAYGLVTGTVRTADGTHIAGVKVWADQPAQGANPDAIAITGTVLDRTTGQPIEGARVATGANIAFTDAEGAYRLLLTPGWYGIEAACPAYRSLTQMMRVEWGFASTAPRFELAAATGRVAGRVVDATTGRPLGYARVWVLTDSWVLTDGEGRFVLDLPEGEQTIRAALGFYNDHRGVRVDLVAGRTVAVPDLLMAPQTGWVEGVVRDALTGSPLPYALVWPDSSDSVSTDEQGRFRLRVTPGTHWLTAVAEGYRDQVQALVRVEPGSTAVVDALSLSPLWASITGTVCSAMDGAPLPGVRVWPSSDGNAATVSDAEGRFQLQVAPGVYTVQAEAAGYQGRATSEVFACAGRTTDAALLWLVPTGATPPKSGTGAIEGQLCDAVAGQPLAGQLVWYDDADLALGALRQEQDTAVPGVRDPYLATCALVGDAAWTDYAFHFEAKATDDDGWGFVLRYQDEQNYYRFLWVNDLTNGGPLRRLERVTGGVRVSLAEDRVPYPSRTWQAVEGAVAGDEIVVRVGGREIMRVRDSALTAGRPGLVCWAQTGQLFRSIRVVQAGETLFAETFTRGMAAWTVADATLSTPASRWVALAPTGAYTDAEGHFRLTGVPIGSHSLYMASQAGFATFRSDCRICTLYTYAGRTASVAAYPAPQGGAVAGLIRNAADGEPAAGVRVWLAGRTESTRTGPDGAFRLEGAAVDYGMNPVRWDVRAAGAAFGGAELQLFTGQAAPGGTASFETALLPSRAPEVAIALNATTSGEPLAGVEVYYGDPALRGGGFALVRDEGSREGNDYLDGPAQLCGDAAWGDAAVQFEVRCSQYSGWGAYLRHQDRLNHYRLFYLVPAGAEGALIQLTRRQGGRTTVLAEARRTHDPNRWYSVRFAVAGQSLTVEMDSQNLFTVADAALTAGRTGVIGWGQNNTTLRNVTVAGPEGRQITAREVGAWAEEAGFGPWGGNPTAVSGPFTGTGAADVTQCRYGTFDYRFPVTEGQYRVELTMTETYFQQAGRRRFNVVLNDRLVEQDLDLWAQAGFKGIIRRTYTTAARNGLLNLLFRPIVDNALVNFIRIYAGRDPAPGEAPVYVLRCGSGSDRPLFQTVTEAGLVSGGWPLTGSDVQAPEGTPAEVAAALRTYREGESTFRLQLAAGAHTVELYFVEHLLQWPGQRVMTVLLNGSPMIRNLDVAGLVGKGKLHRETLTVQSTGEPIDLSLKGQAGYPMISAIRVADGPFINCGSPFEPLWADARGSSFRPVPATSAVTGEDGTARFSDLPAGDYQFRVARPGWATANNDDALLWMPVSGGRRLAHQGLLRPTLSQVAGRVVNGATGQPVAGAEVWYDNRQAVTLTAADGTFRLEGVVPGPRAINVSAAGYKALAGSTTQLQLNLDPGVAVGAALTLVPEAYTPVRPYNPAGNPLFTGADGAWSLLLPAGRRTLYLESAAIGGRRDTYIDVYPALRPRLDLTVGTGLKAVVEGSLSMAGGGALPGPVAVNWGDPTYAMGVLRQVNSSYVSGATNKYPYLGTTAVAGDAAWSDYRFTMQGRCGNDDGWGLTFRYTDPLNYYRLFWLQDPNNGGPLRRLERVVNGVFTTLAEDRAPYPLNQWTDLRVEVVGAAIAVAVAGHEIFRVADSALPAGKVGLYCWSQPNQLFRNIRLEQLDGTPLMVESMTQGLSGWSIVDAAGALPSRWEVVPPTGMATSAEGTFRLEGIPAGWQPVYAFGDIKTSAGDKTLLYLTVRDGDRWHVEAGVGAAAAQLNLRLVDAMTGAAVAGGRVWAASDTRQVGVSDDDGRVSLRLPTGNVLGAPAEQLVYVVAGGYLTRGAGSPQAYLPLPHRSNVGAAVVRLARAEAALAGVVRNAVSSEPLAGMEVAWGEPDHALGAIRVAGGRWHGDPITGVFHGPLLLTSGETWADAAISAEVKAVRSGGVALLLRYRDSGTFYRATFLNDAARSETAITDGVVTGDAVTFTRRGSGWTQVYTGTLRADGTISGTFSNTGKTQRFYGRRRVMAGSDRVSGEWLLNANGYWLRLELSAAPAGGFTGRCLETGYGGSVIRIERYAGGRRVVLGEALKSSHPLNEWARLRFLASGNALRLELGGVTLLEATDSSPLQPGQAGIQAFSGADTLFREVQVKRPTGELVFRGDIDQNLSRWMAAPGWGVVGGNTWRIDQSVADDDLGLVTYERYGSELQYAFGLTPGSYLVELAFSENAFNAAGARIFDVFVNEDLVDPALDVFALVGGRKLLLRRYTVKAGAAGLLLRLKARKDNAQINHIRIWPAAVNPATEPPLVAVRAGSGEGDPGLFLCTNRWGCQGGYPVQAAAGTTIPGVPAEEQPLLLNQRTGNFHYLFRLPAGRYEPELSLVELQYPRQAAARSFDIYANGRLAVAGLDVALIAGNGLLRQRLGPVAVGPDGVLDLEFVSRAGSAMVNLIRIFPEGQASPVAVADAGGPTDRDWAPGAALDQVWAAVAPKGTRTGSDGAFHIGGVPAGTQSVSLRGTGMVTQRTDGVTLTIPVTVGREHRLGLQMTPAVATLSGEVVDIVTGQPVEGAEVWYRGATARWKTDELGQFRIPDFPVDRREIYARAGAYRAPGANDTVLTAQVVGGQEGRYRIFLIPVYSRVEGYVSDAVTGQPVAGARIWLGTQRRGVVSGPEGRFLVTDFPAGQSVPVYVAADGYLAPGSDGHVITLQSVAGRLARFHAFLQPTHGTVQGKLLDLVSQEPVAGALVAIDGGEISTTTDALGQFRLRVPGGDHRLYAEAASLISEAGHKPVARLNVAAGKTMELGLYLKSISGAVEGQVLDSITMQPVPGALVYADEGFANVLTDGEGRYRISQSNREHNLYVKAVDYASEQEDGWMATAPVETDRAVAFNHLLRPTLQLVSFALTEVPQSLELVAGQEQTVTCKVRNTGKREGGATVRLIIPGFQEQENTEWIAPGQEAEFRFTCRTPADALTAPHQEVFFELVGGERQRLLATVRGSEVAVEAELAKPLYTAGETAVLRLRITNRSGGSYKLFTRAQLGDLTQVSALQSITDVLELEHHVPVDASSGKLFFGVYLETGRALFLDAYYLPRQDQLAVVLADQQSYVMGGSLLVTLALTDGGRTFFEGAGTATASFRLVRGDDGTEVLPLREEPLPAAGPLSITFALPAHMRQGTYLVTWNLAAGEKSAAGSYPVDVRGYKARFLEFLTDRWEYLRTDTVTVTGDLELSHAVPCSLDLKLVDPEGKELAVISQALELPAGRSQFRAELPLQTGCAGHHTLACTLYAKPEGVEPILLAGSMQGVDVEGPILLALNTDRRFYRPGDAVQVTVTARGRTTAPLRLTWSTGEVALESMAVLSGLRTLTFTVTAPAGATSLKAEFLGDTVSRLTTPAWVRA